jgi:hypothetical protein
LIDRFGIDTARLYADANRAGCDQFRRWVDSLGIACDYEKKAAFAYASDADRARDIEAEVEAAKAVGHGRGAASVRNRGSRVFSGSGAVQSGELSRRTGDGC